MLDPDVIDSRASHSRRAPVDKALAVHLGRHVALDDEIAAIAVAGRASNSAANGNGSFGSRGRAFDDLHRIGHAEGGTRAKSQASCVLYCNGADPSYGSAPQIRGIIRGLP